MRQFGKYPRSCVYLCRGSSRKGFIIDEYVESGGPLDGQHFIVIQDKDTHEEIHVKKEDVLETID